MSLIQSQTATNIVFNTYASSSIGSINYESSIRLDAYSNIYRDSLQISGNKILPVFERTSAYSVK